MCISCDSGDCGPVHVRNSDILRRAREIEAAMPGEPVSDKSWAVFAGTEGGSILFKEYGRLYCSYEEADASA